MAADDSDPTRLRIEDGDAVVPDEDDLPTHEDLAPEEPAADVPAIGDPNKKPAIPSPVPAHGEMASREQIREAVLAAEEAGGGGTDTSGIATGEADAGRGGPGGSGQGTGDSTAGDPEDTAAAMRRVRDQE